MHTDQILHLIDRGWVTFNPYNWEMNRPPYQVTIAEMEDSISIDIMTPEEMLDFALETFVNWHSPELKKVNKDKVFIFIMAYDSFYEVSYEVAFDDFFEACDFADAHEIYEVYDSISGNVIYTDEEDLTDEDD